MAAPFTIRSVKLATLLRSSFITGTLKLAHRDLPPGMTVSWDALAPWFVRPNIPKSAAATKRDPARWNQNVRNPESYHPCRPGQRQNAAGLGNMKAV
jgi:hypothetical protein